MIIRTPDQSDSGSVNRMQEYLTGLSEQYSAFQALASQTAAIQQLQAAVSASQSQAATSNTALAQQAALAQYMQQVQLATAVSAASTSPDTSTRSPTKPMSNMLNNMAQLSNYAQAQAMMSMMMGSGGTSHTSQPPRRGRGSRGGVGGSPRGRKVGLKLKRLDSGEYVGRGGGRGSRGGMGGRGRKNDYLYMMQSGSAELASARGSVTVSPGSTPVHSVDDSETSSLASLDEQFYTEAYPNKLCAFCNLSEKSFLGQGDMVKYTINEQTLKEYIEKRKKEGSERDASPSERSKSPNSQSLRRKMKKFTSGDTNEPVDELEVIGYQDEVDVSLVFETGGVFYAHFNCALWSGGVSKAQQGDGAKEATVPILKYVSEAVLNGITARCASCKHYGATVPCKASGKMYHWPCAVASGCFMEKASLAMVGVDSYDKVAEVSPTAAYLYYTGDQWKIGKVAELAPAKLCNLLYCTTCGQHYLYSGDHIKITERIRGGWQCQKCKTCQNCRQSGHEDRYLLCDVCDGAYHAYCLRPQMAR